MALTVEDEANVDPKVWEYAEEGAVCHREALRMM